MKNFKIKECKACHTMYQSTGPAAKFCKECSDIRWTWSTLRCNFSYSHRGLPVWVGSGAHEGECHSQKYRKWFLSDIHNKQVGRCNRCDTELDKPNMLLHHIDHDRENNTLDNFEGLCKRCHQIEHECHLALDGHEYKIASDKATGRYFNPYKV